MLLKFSGNEKEYNKAFDTWVYYKEQQENEVKIVEDKIEESTTTVIESENENKIEEIEKNEEEIHLRNEEKDKSNENDEKTNVVEIEKFE